MPKISIGSDGSGSVSAGPVMKKFLLAMLMMLVYMVLYAGVLLFHIQFLSEVLSGTLLTVVSVLVYAGAFFLILPWMVLTTHVVWFFKGEGTPVALQTLKKDLLSVKSYDAPVTAEEKNGAIVFTWKYVDAKWWELFAKAGVRESYELIVKFDEAKKEARLIDIKKGMSWRAGPQDLQFSGHFFRGIILEFEVGKLWGIRENFSIGKVYDYRFVPSEIKNPVMNSILRAGWNVRFSLF